MKRRVFYGMFFSTSISLLLVSIMLCVIFYHQFSSAAMKNLRNRAETFIDNSSQTAVEALAITKSSDMRVTVIMPDGTVVFDNTVQADKMPNHLNRSEIRDAIKIGYGQSVRFSDTLQKETVYYAIRLTDDYVLRVAKTSSSILGMFMGAFPAVMLAVLITGIICYLAAGGFTRRIVEPLSSIDLDGELYAPYDEFIPFIKKIEEQRERIAGQLFEKAEAEKLRKRRDRNHNNIQQVLEKRCCIPGLCVSYLSQSQVGIINTKGGKPMFIKSDKAEESAILNLAYSVCAAARTAPKACGIDHTETAIFTGEDKDRLTAEMRKIGESFGESGKFFCRDADNVDAAGAVVLVGAKYEVRGLGEKCKLCGFDNCSACENTGAVCVFTAMDLGIALGSAVSLVADNRVDNRIMFTIGQAAARLGLLGEYKLIMGIPLSVSGKSVFYDRA